MPNNLVVIGNAWSVYLFLKKFIIIEMEHILLNKGAICKQKIHLFTWSLREKLDYCFFHDSRYIL